MKIAVIARLQAHDGMGGEVVAAVEQVRPLVEAEAGTELFLAHRKQSEPDVVWIYELYTDSEAFERHKNGGALPRVQHLLAAPAVVTVAPVAAGKGS